MNALPRLLLPVFVLSLPACATTPAQPVGTAQRAPVVPRGFVVTVHDRGEGEAAILALASRDPSHTTEHELSTSDGHYAVRASFRAQGADGSRRPCLEVRVSRRAMSPLPDAELHGCVVPGDDKVSLGEVRAEGGKPLSVVVAFLPSRDQTTEPLRATALVGGP